MAEKDTIKAIREHVLTEARNAKNDVVTLPGARGGVEFRVLSYLDVLLENDIITPSQYSFGEAYWRLKEAAFPRLQVKVTSLYDECGMQVDEAVEIDGEPESSDFYIALCRRIAAGHLRAINASCIPLESNYLPHKLAIVWAFGVNNLEAAFTDLEKQFPIVRDEMQKLLDGIFENA